MPSIACRDEAYHRALAPGAFSTAFPGAGNRHCRTGTMAAVARFPLWRIACFFSGDGHVCLHAGPEKIRFPGAERPAHPWTVFLFGRPLALAQRCPEPLCMDRPYSTGKYDG